MPLLTERTNLVANALALRGLVNPGISSYPNDYQFNAWAFGAVCDSAGFPALAAEGLGTVKNMFLPYGHIQRYGANSADTVSAANCIAFQNAILAVNALGGGDVIIPDAVFTLTTVSGPYKVFARPRSNVRIRGIGTNATLKAAAGLNTATAGDGFAFIRHVADDELIASISNFVVENVTFDHNGTNNLVPAGNPNKTNMAVSIAVGSNIRVQYCRFLSNAGLQTLSFGNNVNPQSVTDLRVTDNYFQDQGGSVTGNVNSVDHSTVYAQATHVDISRNRFINTNAQNKNTALEIHSSYGTVNGNTGTNFAHAFNIVATVCPQVGMVYRHNKFTNVERGINFATQSGFLMDDVLVEGNTFVQDANALTDLMDFSTSVVTAIAGVTMRNNRFEAATAAGTSNTTGGVAIGLVKRLTLSGNKYKNIPGRAITMNAIDASLRLVIEGEDIEDCGTTTNAGFQAGIQLNSLVTVPFLRIAGCKIANVAGTYMTSAIGGNINVTKGEVVDNEVSGVATEMNWSSPTTPPRISHRAAGAPGGLNVIAAVGSQWLRTDGGAATTLYIKESGTTGAGWVAK